MSNDEEWPQYSRDDSQYYIFNAEKKGLGFGPRATPCAFWNDFLPRLQGHPSYEEPGCNGVAEESTASGAKTPAHTHVAAAVMAAIVFSFY